MHMFIMFEKYVQGLKKIQWKLWEELITQTSYPIMLKAPQND